jgi:hypothetical protein
MTKEKSAWTYKNDVAYMGFRILQDGSVIDGEAIR